MTHYRDLINIMIRKIYAKLSKLYIKQCSKLIFQKITIMSQISLFYSINKRIQYKNRLSHKKNF